jgi:hypothetical protein
MRICAASLGIGLSLNLTGCAVGSKSMSIDSTSRMPWFGLELKGRKKKTEGPLFPSVRLGKENKSRLAVVGLPGGKSTDGDEGPRGKVSTSLPTTDRSVVLDSTASRDVTDLDFR